MKDEPKPPDPTATRAESEVSASGCSAEYFYVVMLAQKFDEHFEAFGGTIPVRMSKGCPKRFLAVFADRQEAIEWAGDESKVRMAKSS